MANIKNLHLKQYRKYFTEKTTISELFIDTKPMLCYMLEDKDRGLQDSMTEKEIAAIKVKTATCIGYGKYNIDITLSGRFGVWLPLITPVKGFSGIRQHKGNYAEDTEGCPLPGMKRGVDCVTQSTDAFYKLLFIYLNHLLLDTPLATKLVELHKTGKEGAKEFGELFTKNRIAGQTITIEIIKI